MDFGKLVSWLRIANGIFQDIGKNRDLKEFEVFINAPRQSMVSPHYPKNLGHDAIALIL